MPFKSEKQRKWMWVNDPEMAKKWEKEGKLKREKYMKIRELIKKLVREELSETAKRDYKAEYKKFQSSTKSKKYRAELNKYNRDKGTYGNGDGKDASHKGGKIVGFEEESKNRGRAEKSRLKKEEKLSEDFKNNEWEVYVADENRREKIVKVAKSKRAAVILYNKLINTDKYHEVGMRVVKEGKLSESGIMYRAGVKKYGKEGMTKIQQAAGKGKGHEEIGKIKDKYDKTKKDEGKLKEISNSEAKTLLKQLGGNRFMAMTGAKDFGIGKDGLHFKIGRNAKTISHVVIDYNRGKDLYDMKFLRVRAGKIKVVKKVEDVYFDQLGEIFKRYTGMNVRL